MPKAKPRYDLGRAFSDQQPKEDFEFLFAGKPAPRRRTKTVAAPKIAPADAKRAQRPESPPRSRPATLPVPSGPEASKRSRESSPWTVIAGPASDPIQPQARDGRSSLTTSQVGPPPQALRCLPAAELGGFQGLIETLCYGLIGLALRCSRS